MECHQTASFNSEFLYDTFLLCICCVFIRFVKLMIRTSYFLELHVYIRKLCMCFQLCGQRNCSHFAFSKIFKIHSNWSKMPRGGRGSSRQSFRKLKNACRPMFDALAAATRFKMTH